jgi:hypothetical protein
MVLGRLFRAVLVGRIGKAPAHRLGSLVIQRHVTGRPWPQPSTPLAEAFTTHVKHCASPKPRAPL